MPVIYIDKLWHPGNAHQLEKPRALDGDDVERESKMCLEFLDISYPRRG